MHLTKTLRVFLLAALSIVAFGAASSTAAASTGVAITNGVTLTTANGPLTLTASGLTVICQVRLGIGLNQRISKTPLAAIGSILPSPTSTISNCNLGITGTVGSGITLNYVNFSGGLPNITAIGASGLNANFSLTIPSLGRTCVFTGTVPASLARDTATGNITSASLSAPSGSLRSSTAGCPTSAGLNGRLTVLAPIPVTRLI